MKIPLKFNKTKHFLSLNEVAITLNDAIEKVQAQQLGLAKALNALEARQDKIELDSAENAAVLDGLIKNIEILASSNKKKSAKTKA